MYNVQTLMPLKSKLPDFDLPRSLKVKADGAVGLPIHHLLLVSTKGV